MSEALKQTFLTTLAAVMLAGAGAAHAKRDFPVPPGAELAAVAGDMEYEGMTLNVRRFEIAMSVEEVLNFYRKSWEGRYVENDMPPWRMISTRDGGEFYTVQVQPSGAANSWGYLGISDLPRMLEEGGTPGGNRKPFPMMSGSTVVNDIESRDAGRRGRTLLINNGFSVQGNASYYREHYESQGWTTLIDQSADPAGNHVLMFQLGSETVNLTIDTGERGTNIVVNKVRNELF